MEAYTQGSSLTADQGIILSAASTATINATVDATSVAVAASTSSSAVGASAAGVETDNEIYLTIYAGIDGGTGVLAKQGNISVTAGDASTITSDAQAVSVTADLSGGGTSAGVSIGLSLAMNTIDNDVQAYITSAGTATASAGAIGLSATEKSTITDTSTAASIAVGASSSSTGLALSGGGAEATNVIFGGAQAYVTQHQPRQLRDDQLERDGHLDHHGAGARRLRLAQLRHFERHCRLDRRRGGGKPDRLRHQRQQPPLSPSRPTSSIPASTQAAPTPSRPLLARRSWRPRPPGRWRSRRPPAAPASAVSGSGVFVENEIADTVLAYDDGGTSTAGIIAPSISISASDTSKITATAAAASLAASFGNTGVSISIGLSLATNQINNDVEAYIANAVTPVAPASTRRHHHVGGISVMSTENATINATIGSGVAGRGRRPGDRRGDQRGGRRGDQRHPGQGQRVRLRQ